MVMKRRYRNTIVWRFLEKMMEESVNGINGR
jgi:hypothetical protein